MSVSWAWQFKDVNVPLVTECKRENRLFFRNLGNSISEAWWLYCSYKIGFSFAKTEHSGLLYKQPCHLKCCMKNLQASPNQNWVKISTNSNQHSNSPYSLFCCWHLTSVGQREKNHLDFATEGFTDFFVCLFLFVVWVFVCLGFFVPPPAKCRNSDQSSAKMYHHPGCFFKLASSLVFKERPWQTHAILNANYKKFSKEGRKDPAEGFE